MYRILLPLSLFCSSCFGITGSELLRNCKGDYPAPLNYVVEMQCMGYVSGVLDGIQLNTKICPESKFICSPDEGLTVEQLTKIVIKYLEEHPEDLQEEAKVLVIIALAKAFPCKNPPKWLIK